MPLLTFAYLCICSVCSLQTELRAQLQRAYWIVSEWCCWGALCGKRQMGCHQGAAARWSGGGGDGKMRLMRRGVDRSLGTWQHNNIPQSVAWFHFPLKSCTVDTILSSIILPLENTSTCTICQPRPLWGRRSLCCSPVPREYIHPKPRHNLCLVPLLLLTEL